MKPELLSEERLAALYEQVSEQQIPVDFAEFCTIARAALNELNIQSVVTVRSGDHANCPAHDYEFGGCFFEHPASKRFCGSGGDDAPQDCRLRKGPCLVRRTKP